MMRAMLVVAAVVSVLACVVRADDEYSCEHCRRERAERMAELEQPGGAARTRDATFDEATGKDKLNYPPHKFVDIRSMKLRVAIRDMQTPLLVGQVAYEVSPAARSVSEWTIQAGPPESMAIGEVRMVRGARPGASVEPEVLNYTRERGAVTLRFDPPLAADESGPPARITIPYVLRDPPDGLHWTLEGAAWPDRPAQIHSQGQAESNHFWFPCHDFPNERMATELEVTVPTGFMVSSNGRLVERMQGWAPWATKSLFPAPDPGQAEVIPWESAEVPDDGKPRPWDAASGTSYETWHWSLERGHVSYLVSMVVGKFDVVDVGGRVPAVGGVGGDPARKLSLPVYVPPGKGPMVKQTYGRTLEMIKLFETKLDEAYPWGDRYAQLVVHNFGAGGMENTGATSMYDLAYFDKTALLDGDLDGLISHELGHQWFGDLLTCNSWEHIWLNEGFATYMSDLWFEHRDGREAYDAMIWGHHRGLASGDRAEAPFRQGMASKAYENAWEAFRRGANPYPKGASVLAMLRAKMGDDVFFKGMAGYVDKFKEKTPRTADFRRSMEQASGYSLQRFFDQWVLRPGVPKVKVTTSYDESQRALTVTVAQTQPVDGYNPAFELDVPMVIGLSDGTTIRPRVKFDTKEASLTIGGVAPARWVNADPEQTQLVDYDVVQSATAWTEVLSAGGPLGGRLRAAEALGKVNSDSSEADEASTALLSVLRDRDINRTLRSETAESLGKLGRVEELMNVLSSRDVSDARVRRSVVSAIGAPYRVSASPSATPVSPRAAGLSETAADVLANVAARDESYGVRGAAVRALGSMKATRHLPVVLAALTVESQNDQIRQAALQAVADMDERAGFDAVLEYTRPGWYSRTRPDAVEAVAKLAKHDPERAYTTMVDLLNDSEGRTAQSAGAALVTIKDPRGVAVLEEYVQTQRKKGDESSAKAGERWVKSLKDKLSGA